MKRKAKEDRGIHSFFTKRTSTIRIENDKEAGGNTDTERTVAVEMSGAKRGDEEAEIQSEREHVESSTKTAQIRPESEMSKNTHEVSHCPPDISKSRGEAPVQPRLKVFPRTVQGDRRRSFKSEWYTTHSWLEYSTSADSAFCYACRHFSLPSHTESPFTSSSGFKNWKKATFKDGGLVAHSRTEHHRDAMMAWKDFEMSEKKQESLMGNLNKEYNKKVKENREYIKTLAEVLLYTATQNIGQRGHNESMESHRKGNFLGILELLAKHNPNIMKKMNAVGNAKYTSADIQNEILSCLAEMVRTSIIQEVKKSEVFSILADETKDLSKKEQISFVIRYYYNGAINESFLQFEHAERLDAEGLTQKIIDILERYGLEYKSNLVGQSYDGAAVMSGRHRGVQTRVKQLAKQAFYVHCNAHCLNLVLVDTVKAIPEANCFFSLLQKLYVFMSGSVVHQKWLQIQGEMYPGSPRELQRLSDTRWACRYLACRNLMDRLPAVVRVLEEIAGEQTGERSVDAQGLLFQIDMEFIAFLAIFKKLFGDAKFLSDMLQSSSLDLAKAVDLVEALISTFENYRNEQAFDDVWTTVLGIAEQCNICTETAPKRKRKLSTKLEATCVMSTVGSQAALNSKEVFRAGVFYQVLDMMLNELRTRFSKQNCDIMRGIQALNPSSDTFCEKDVLFPFARMYESNLEDLVHELYQVKRILDRKVKQGIQKPCSILDLAVFVEPYKEVFQEFFRLCKIAVAIPVSTAACERSFSCLKLIKTHLRSSMADNRLSDLGILSIECKRAKSLNLDEFVDIFARNHNNRRIQLL